MPQYVVMLESNDKVLSIVVSRKAIPNYYNIYLPWSWSISLTVESSFNQKLTSVTMKHRPSLWFITESLQNFTLFCSPFNIAYQRWSLHDLHAIMLQLKIVQSRGLKIQNSNSPYCMNFRMNKSSKFISLKLRRKSYWHSIIWILKRIIN